MFKFGIPYFKSILFDDSWNTINVTSFDNCFSSCTTLTNIPANLFNYPDMLFKFGQKYNQNIIEWIPYTPPNNKLGRSFKTLRILTKEIKESFIKKYNLKNVQIR
jgi:hypothetical protein